MLIKFITQLLIAEDADEELSPVDVARELICLCKSEAYLVVRDEDLSELLKHPFHRVTEYSEDELDRATECLYDALYLCVVLHQLLEAILPELQEQLVDPSLGLLVL